MEEPSEKKKKIEVNLKVWPILDPKISCDDVPSTSFEALILENKKLIGKIISKLKDLPANLQHLKRVGKDGSILISENRELAEQIINNLSHLGLNTEHLKTVQVPSSKPFTRRQFEYAKTLWPCGFHPDHEVEKLLSGSFLTKNLKIYIEKWMRLVVEMGNGCVAVQNEIQISSGTPSQHPLGHPVMEMVGSLPKRSGNEYLGTGADVFLVNEPCAMCSMALVHFRIKRLFYWRNSKNGVLKEDGWQLHLEPSINHHYQVFRVEMDFPENSNNYGENCCYCASLE